MAIKTFLFASLALLATTAALYMMMNSGSQKSTYVKSFMNHKKTYNKIHASREELEYRFAIYSENMRYIESQNASGKSFTLGETQFTDITFEEFSQKYLLAPILNTPKSDQKNKVPEGEVDWDKEGKVSRVKNQMACGSCWAFSTTGSLEAAYAIFKSENREFSEQELVDCSAAYGNQGCNGGIMSAAFDYIQNKKLATEDYSYTAKEDQCKSDDFAERYGITSYKVIDPVDVSGLVIALNNQPVSVAIEVRKDFMHYTGGIYESDKTCGNALNHGVLVVGYKNTSEENYFKVKNSWSETWGEKGYIRMAIGSDSGTCGIANETDVYPVL